MAAIDGPDRDEITDTGVGTAALETANSIVDGYASGIYACCR